MRTLAVFVFLAVAAVPPARAADKCTCRAMGRNFELGQTVCLRLPSGQNRLARCGLVLNNTAWEISDIPCVVSVRPVRPSLASIVVRERAAVCQSLAAATLGCAASACGASALAPAPQAGSSAPSPQARGR